MKKVLTVILVTLVVAAVAAFIFQEPLKQALMDGITSDMFVATDSDSFDPGVPVGEKFPAIAAELAGRTVTDISEFSGPNGLIFVANRSVDW